MIISLKRETKHFQFTDKYIVVWPWLYSLSCDEVKQNEAVRSSSSEFNSIKPLEDIFKCKHKLPTFFTFYNVTGTLML